MSSTFDKQHDDYKLGTPYDDNEDDKVECTHCEQLFDEDDLNEVNYRDADRGIHIVFICVACEESQFWT